MFFVGADIPHKARTSARPTSQTGGVHILLTEREAAKFRRKIKEIGNVTGWLRKVITARSIQISRHRMFRDVERFRYIPTRALGMGEREKLQALDSAWVIRRARG